MPYGYGRVMAVRKASAKVQCSECGDPLAAIEFSDLEREVKKVTMLERYECQSHPDAGIELELELTTLDDS